MLQKTIDYAGPRFGAFFKHKAHRWPTQGFVVKRHINLTNIFLVHQRLEPKMLVSRPSLFAVFTSSKTA